MELGRLELELDHDPDKSSEYFKKALNWFQQSRARRDALNLFGALPEKLREFSTPKKKPVTYDQWYRLVYNKEEPTSIVNRSTAPWFISTQECECLFMIGFFLFMENKFDQAKKYFSQVGNLDKDLAMLDAKNIPNVLMRLKGACKQGFMIGTPEEMKAFSGENRLNAFYGDMQFLLSRFNDSEKFYREILKDRKISNSEKVYAFMGVANSLRMQGDGKSAGKYYQYALKAAGRKKCMAEANTLYSYAFFLLQSEKLSDNAKGLEYLERCYRGYPRTRYGESALYHMVMVNSFKDRGKAKAAARRYKQAYPDGKYLKNIDDLINKDLLTKSRLKIEKERDRARK